MQRAIALSLLVLLGTIGFSAYAYTFYLPSISTASSGTGTMNIYLADPPPSNHTLKYLLVNVTSVTLKYSSNITQTTTTSSVSSSSESSTASSSNTIATSSETSLNASSFVNRFVYNVSSSVGTNVNLTEYQGSSLLLGSPKVPKGNVTGVVLNISGARAFWTNGSSTQLKVVANGKLMVNVQFAVQAGGTANMDISITPSSVHVSQGDVLRPVLLVTVTRSATTSMTTTSSTTTSATSSSSSSQSSA